MSRYLIQAFDETESEWFSLYSIERHDDALKAAKRTAWRRGDVVRVVDTALWTKPGSDYNVVGCYSPEHYEGTGS